MTTNTMTFNITACMIFRDEAHILAEWLEYHMMLGVEHFFLYSHMSQDNYKEVLQPYIANKQVTLMEWNFPRRKAAPGGGGPFPQVTAYDHAMQRLRGVTNWMVVIDSDEFLAQMSDVTLSEFLARQEDNVAVVVLNWAMFGTNGHKTRPEGLTIENYTRRTEIGDMKNRHVKAIVNPARVTKSLGPHHWRVGRNSLGEEYPVVDEHGVRLSKETQTKPFIAYTGTPQASWDVFRVNHYVTRSEEEFRHKMLSRGRISSGVMEDEEAFKRHFNSHDKGDIEDTRILEVVPELKRRLKGRNQPYSNLMDAELYRIKR